MNVKSTIGHRRPAPRFCSWRQLTQPAAPSPAPTRCAADSAGCLRIPAKAMKDRATALVQGGSSGSTPAPASGAAAATASDSADTTDVPPPPPGVLTPEEEAYLNNYLARLQYMVYFDEKPALIHSRPRPPSTRPTAICLRSLGFR